MRRDRSLTIVACAFSLAACIDFSRLQSRDLGTLQSDAPDLSDSPDLAHEDLGSPPDLTPLTPRLDGTWIRMGGSSTLGQVGSYLTQGTANPGSYPGGRDLVHPRLDASGNVWIFGGLGFDATGKVGGAYLSDLWKFDGTNWTWVSGASVGNQPGVYGQAAAANHPGARKGSGAWIDAAGRFWIFGGKGFDAAGTTLGWLNDLWRFDGTIWTWVAGSQLINSPGSATEPSAREDLASWIDAGGRLWIFGGAGADSGGIAVRYNDTWFFDPATLRWTLVGGSPAPNQPGVYGTRGVPSAANLPGSRDDAAVWRATNGTLWMYGGGGYDETGTFGFLNDLWRFDGAFWTWVAGEKVGNGVGSYELASPAALPSSREDACLVSDDNGHIWIFGGIRVVAGPPLEAYRYNDLWRYDGTTWTWVNGAATANVVATSDRQIGSLQNPACWINQTGELWVFGGLGVMSSGATEYLNAWWKFR